MALHPSSWGGGKLGTPSPSRSLGRAQGDRETGNDNGAWPVSQREAGAQRPPAQVEGARRASQSR